MQTCYDLTQGDQPLLISMPHVGTLIPDELRYQFQPRALDVEDTDWHIDRLYNFAGQIGASTLRANFSRYVIDLNRPPDNAPMYPGASNTELCPTRFFNGDPLYRTGLEPDAGESQRRLRVFWEPYHQALSAELLRLKAKFGFALLWDAHSIRSEIPWLFEGRLPNFNIGTANGEAAADIIAKAVFEAAQKQPPFSSVLNGRFKGGYTTRHYGKPKDQIHAIQLELTQDSYMDEFAPFAWHEQKAIALRPSLQHLVETALKATRESVKKAGDFR